MYVYVLSEYTGTQAYAKYNVCVCVCTHMYVHTYVHTVYAHVKLLQTENSQ